MFAKPKRAAAAQSAQIGIAEAEFYPHISHLGTLDWQSANIKDLVSPGSLQGNFGPSYQWDILNYGRILNNVRACMDALFDALITLYQTTVLNAAQETENGLVTFLKSQEQAKFQNESVVAAKKAVDQRRACSTRAVFVDFNRVATLETMLVQQQDLPARHAANLATGLIDLYRALGGGWQIRLGPTWPNPLFQRPHRRRRHRLSSSDENFIPAPKP